MKVLAAASLTQIKCGALERQSPGLGRVNASRRLIYLKILRS
jgi:hypothetical protein